MKPYYDSGGITIYHGDCREVLTLVPRSDLLCTDPPYGLSDRWSGGTWGSADKYKDAKRWDVLVDPEVLFLLVKHCSQAIVWGFHHYCGFPPTRGLLSWVKTNAVPTMAAFEVAWTNTDRPSRAWHGHNNQPDFGHPTSKPLGLMTWCLRQYPEARTVFDPFAGSGTTLVAAKLDCRKAIGIEIEERYCEIAANRLAQGVLDFPPPPEKKVDTAPSETDDIRP